MRRFSFNWSLAAQSIRAGHLQLPEPVAPDRIVCGFDGAAVRRALDPGRPTRLYVLHMALFVGLLVLGWTAVESSRTAAPPTWAIVALAAAVLIRCGTVPAHCWLTDWFEHASFGIAILFVAPLSGVYAAVRLVLPIGPYWILRGIGLLSLTTAIYAAGMATIQRDTRRFFAYLFISHSSLVLVGLELHTMFVFDGLALSLVLGDRFFGRFRAHAPGVGIAIRSALAQQFPRTLRALSDAGRFFLADGIGERGIPLYSRLHLHRVAGR